jgi:hypothetical protein
MLEIYNIAPMPLVEHVAIWAIPFANENMVIIGDQTKWESSALLRVVNVHL